MNDGTEPLYSLTCSQLVRGESMGIHIPSGRWKKVVKRKNKFLMSYVLGT